VIIYLTQDHHFTSLHFPSLHFSSHHFTSFHFTSLHIILFHLTSFHFTSLQCTASHCTALPILHFPAFLDVSPPPFKALHFSSLIITFLTLFLKICDLQRKVVEPLQAVGSTVWFSYLQRNIYRCLFFVSWS